MKIIKLSLRKKINFFGSLVILLVIFLFLPDHNLPLKPEVVRESIGQIILTIIAIIIMINTLLMEDKK